MGLLDKLRKNVRKVADDIAGDPGQKSEAPVATEAARAEERAGGGEALERGEFAEPDAAPSARDSM